MALGRVSGLFAEVADRWHCPLEGFKPRQGKRRWDGAWCAMGGTVRVPMSRQHGSETGVWDLTAVLVSRFWMLIARLPQQTTLPRLFLSSNALTAMWWSRQSGTLSDLYTAVAASEGFDRRITAHPASVTRTRRAQLAATAELRTVIVSHINYWGGGEELPLRTPMAWFQVIAAGSDHTIPYGGCWQAGSASSTAERPGGVQAARQPDKHSRRYSL